MLKLGIAGLGVVGKGCLSVLAKNKQIMELRAGKQIELVAVASRSKQDVSAFDNVTYYSDGLQMIQEHDLDIVIETIGGSSGVAYDLVKHAIAKKCHVVTANKALIASHGNEFIAAAKKQNVALAFEAAIGGSIPCVKVLKDSLDANNVNAVYGLLNGTANYILTQMLKTGASFDDILSDAQKKGYAEADPSFDIEGTDTAHKLAILAAIAFGQQIDFDNVRVDGITNITDMDISFATELGYKIKLMALARKTPYGIEQRVQPVMLPKDNMVATVDGVLNTVVYEGDFCGTMQLTGAGAGSEATASAIMSDVMDIAKGQFTPPLGLDYDNIIVPTPMQLEDAQNSYYLRITCEDKLGVLAQITTIFANHSLSVMSALQHGKNDDNSVAIVFTLDKAKRQEVMGAISEIEALQEVKTRVTAIRIEEF